MTEPIEPDLDLQRETAQAAEWGAADHERDSITATLLLVLHNELGSDLGPGLFNRLTSVLDRAMPSYNAQVAAKALEDAAAEIDREAAQDEAAFDVADVRCDDCRLRYDERDQYGCFEDGRPHEYDAAELAAAAELRIEPTYYGDGLRDRADRIRREAGGTT